MSLVKYRLRDVASDFGMAPKEIAEVISKFFEKPKSNTQVLTDDELNVIFDYITQTNQIESLEVVFAVQPAPKKEEPKKEEPKAEEAEESAKEEAKEEAKAAEAAEAAEAAPAAAPAEAPGTIRQSSSTPRSSRIEATLANCCFILLWKGSSREP